MTHNLIKWDDFRIPTLLGNSLFHDLEKLFNVGVSENGVLNGIPSVDVIDQKESYLIEVELPGLEENDVDIKMNNHILTISSKKETKSTEKDSAWMIKERRSLVFKRSFELPNDTNSDKIQATFKNGLLVIEIPKKEESKERNIPIKVA